MIFVTVGTQLPFDRLVQAMDEWAAAHPEQEVIVQTGGGEYQPQHMHSESFMGPERYRELLDRCSQVVAHAGMGSILSAQEYDRPLLIMPRSLEFKEVRSEHQHSTCKKYADRPRVLIAWETVDLGPQLDDLLNMPLKGGVSEAGKSEVQALNAAIVGFVEDARGRVDGAPSRRVICACSTGGHLVQMLRMLDCLKGHELIIMTSDAKDSVLVPAYRHYAIREASRWSWSMGLSTWLQLMFLIPRLRPDVVLSTGAAPGLMAVIVGKLSGARVIWIDSLANVDRISLGGRLARIFTHLFLVQWPDLADGTKARYAGRVQ